MQKKVILITLVIIFGTITIVCFYTQKNLIDNYNKQESSLIIDRNNTFIALKENNLGYYNQFEKEIPENLKNIIILKEDQWFNYHLGINPITIIRSFKNDFRASSTITQQLTKILLGNELERNVKNKLTETGYAILLELFHSKNEILTMYLNSIYFGNQIQGIKEASKYYFNVNPELLSNEQILQLLVTINNPSNLNPNKEKNIEKAIKIGKVLNIENNENYFQKGGNYNHFEESFFEIKDFIKEKETQKTTIDIKLTERVRNIVKKSLTEIKSANNAAVIIVKIPENEILTLIGSPDPSLEEKGYKINMLLEERAIGSTIKPFIYLKAFENGARPYTSVNDIEYKYTVASGYPLYPKNFDYSYIGETSLHYSLSNSLNVPTVKTLEFVTVDTFSDFLIKDLKFSPIQKMKNYNLGIALGALEMNLYDLARIFTIFPNNGNIKDLKIYKEDISNSQKITEEKYIELINKILADRETGVDQFGMQSHLNLNQTNYAFKTGTSRDYIDSLIVGYTPDYLVAVWVGNVENTSMEEITGKAGAGKIWADVMNLMSNTEYNYNTPFNFNELVFIKDDYGLKNDNYKESLNILIKNNDSLIIAPHNNDTFLFDENMAIRLKAKEDVDWYINDKFITSQKEYLWKIYSKGIYKIEVIKNGNSETVTIKIN